MRASWTSRITSLTATLAVVGSSLVAATVASVVGAPTAQAATGCRAGATSIVSGSALVCQERLTESSTWTPPAEVELVDVVVVGGGGGGGGGAFRGSPYLTAGASGGGAGQVASRSLVPGGSPVAVSIGAGGAPGARGVTAGDPGLPGEQSSFGSLTAPGGTGGGGAILDGSVTRGGGSGRDVNGAAQTSVGGTSANIGIQTVGGGGAGAGSPQAGPSRNASIIYIQNVAELRAGDGGTGLNTVTVGGLFGAGPDQWLAGGGAGGLSYIGQYGSDAGYYGGGDGVWAGRVANAVANTGGGGGGGGYRFALGNADVGGAGGSGVVLVRWTPPPVIAGSTFPSAVTSTQFNQPLAVQPQTGAAPFTWSLESGSLPAGLSLSPGGIVSGVPSGPAGSSPFTVKVVDSRGAEATAARSIDVEVALEITTTTVPGAFRTYPYSATFAATGGTAPYDWYISTGRLPTGLTLNGNGTLTGTPTSSGTFSIRVGVRDVSWRYTSAPFTIVVTSVSALSITTTSLPVGARGLGYSSALQATGGAGTHVWSLASGSLPPGLSLSSQGLISGTPTTAGSYTFTPQVTAGTVATRSLTLTVANELSITTDTLPSGATLAAYSTTFAASGGTSYAWAVTDGSLPAGLALSSAGALTGTPTTAGASSFTVTVTDNFGRTESQAYTLVVSASPPLTITTSAVPEGEVGIAYTDLVQASGGVGARTWSVVSGSLPAGLTLDTDGTLHGKPTAAGPSTFTAQVTTGTETVTQSLTLVVRARLEIATDTLPTGATLTGYSTTLTATGASSYAWAITAGSLPTGLSLGTDGTISGTPTTAGVSSFTVTVTDNLSRTESKTFALGINQTPPLAIVTASLDSGEVDTAYTAELQATGGVGSHAWSLASGTLPVGLSLKSDGTLTGIPTTAGSRTFTVRVTTGGETATRQLTLVVRAQLEISTVTLPSGGTLVPYSRTLAATGGTTYSWAVTAGSLPAGLSLSVAGVLSGTPTVAGASSFTVTVTDNFARTQSRAFALGIAQSPPLTIITAALDNGEVGIAYTEHLQATGGVGARTWSVSSGSLPPGMTLQADGMLTGIPTTAGPSTFTVRVTTGGETTSQPLTLVVRATLAITTDTLPTGATLVPYSGALTASGGAPYTWAVTSGSLPAGLLLASDGTISGTPDAAGGRTVTVTVTDTHSRTESKAFLIAIAQTPPLAVVTGALPPGTVGAPYSGVAEATGGLGPRAWSIASGALPAGLSLDADGTVTGVPTAVGTSTLTLRVATDTETVERQVTITIDVQVSITTASLPSVAVGGAYSQTLAATGGDGTYRWTLAGGQLPPGLSLNATTGVVAGTVLASARAGTYRLTVDAVDGRGGLGTKTISLTVLSPVRVVTAVVPAAGLAGPYSTTLQAGGGTGPYTWSQVGPTLPPGLALDSSTGRVSGKVFAAGQFQFRVRTTDSRGNAAIRLLSLSVSSGTVAQTQLCATLPSRLPVNGARLVVNAHCRTSAQQVVTASVRCTGGIVRTADARACAIARNSAGRQVVRTYGYRPLTVQVTLSAPATSGYRAYRVTKTYFLR